MIKRSIKLQIMWASVILITVLVLGYLGIFALQKGMTIKMTYPITPNIRCELFLHRTADGQVGGEDIYNRIFSNLSGDEFVGEGIVLDEQQSTLAFQNTFAGGVGAGFKLRILNYTTENILVEATGTGVAYTSVELDAYEDSTLDTSNNILTVATVTNNIVLKFTKFIYSVAVNTYEGIDDTIPTTTSHYYCGNALIIPITATEYHSVPSQVSITTGNASSFGYEPIIEYNASNVATSVWNEAEITITPTSNCTINVYLNPWTYGQYTTGQFQFTDGKGNTQYLGTIWNGYYYVQFKKISDTDPDVRWIIIGESENIYSNYSNESTTVPANSGLLNTGTYVDEEDETVRCCPALNDSLNIVGGDGNVYSPGISPKTRMFQELMNNQVLLYREETINPETYTTSPITYNYFNASTTQTATYYPDKWSGSYLQNYLNSSFMATSQLDSYSAYIDNMTLYSVYKKVTGLTTNKFLVGSVEQIFVLSTIGGHVIDANSSLITSNGVSPSGTGEFEGDVAPNWLTDDSFVYLNQNFNIEMYLGGYNFTTTGLISSYKNKKLFINAGQNKEFQWLRSATGFYASLGGAIWEYHVDATDIGARPAFVLDLAKNYVSAT